jgi:flavin reductase (DIM6/NTAB) family NADH-FMN oxidoreductase RutF
MDPQLEEGEHLLGARQHGELLGRHRIHPGDVEHREQVALDLGPGLLDPDSDLCERLIATGRGVVCLLGWEHRDLADAFAGVAPAPGGVFRLGAWEQTSWGPRLEGASAWAGFTVDSTREVGWSLLVDGVLDEIHLDDPGEPLVHRRGRYLRPGGTS